MISAKKLFGWSGMAHVIEGDPAQDAVLLLYHGPSRSLFLHMYDDMVMPTMPHGESSFILPILQSDLGWDLGSYDTDPKKKSSYPITIDHSVHTAVGEFCRIPKKKNLSRCDLLVQLSLIDKTALWHSPMKTLCRRYNRPIQEKAVATISRIMILHKRPEFFFRKIHRPSQLRKRDILRTCNHKINWAYIQKIMKRPDLSIVVAEREISMLSEKCKTSAACMQTRKKECKTPDTWTVYRALCRKRGKNPDPDEYRVFKANVFASYPDPVARNAHLCTMAFKPIGNVFGGFCMFTETDRRIIVWILCSDRALGRALLEHFIATGKTIVIDTPLADVVGFYEKCGFRFNDFDKSQMVRLPSSTPAPLPR